MILFIRDKDIKQYHRSYNGNLFPEFNPKKGWRKGMKYSTLNGRVFIVDSVDAERKTGELRLHVTRIK